MYSDKWLDDVKDHICGLSLFNPNILRPALCGWTQIEDINSGFGNMTHPMSKELMEEVTRDLGPEVDPNIYFLVNANRKNFLENLWMRHPIRVLFLVQILFI